MTDSKPNITCTDCGVEIVLETNLEVGDIVECQECGTEMEILSLNPLKYVELIEEK